MNSVSDNPAPKEPQIENFNNLRVPLTLKILFLNYKTIYLSKFVGVDLRFGTTWKRLNLGSRKLKYSGSFYRI